MSEYTPPSKDEIIKELYDTEFVQNYSRQVLVNKEHYDDAVQEIWVIVCNFPEDRLQKWYLQGGINKVRQVVGGVICRQLRSTRSKFYNQYVRDNMANLQMRVDNDPKIKWTETDGYDI